MAATVSPADPTTRISTIGDAIRANASADPERIALISPNIAPLPYGALVRQIDSTAFDLRKAGLGANARVGVAIPHGPEAVVAIVAVTCSAIAVPIDPRLTASEAGDRIAILNLDALIAPPGRSDVRSAAEMQGIPVFELGPAGLEPGFTLNWQGPCRPPQGDEDPTPDSPAFLLPTSGTTAQPRLVPFSHGNQIACAARIKSWYGLGRDDRCLCMAQIFYSHGLTVAIFTPLITGGSIALPQDLTNIELTEWFVALGPTWCTGGPPTYRRLLEKAAEEPHLRSLHSLRFMVSAGMELPPDVLRGAEERFGVPMLNHYGTTETGMLASNRREQGLRKVGTCGLSTRGLLRIAGPDGKTLAPGEIGEVLAGGPTVMAGYLNNPVANRDAFIDGWFRTGDLGTIDKDGFLHLQGRAKEVINQGGRKISPVEVDAALLRHPSVADAAAFAIPHPRTGEQVAAAVVIRDGEQRTIEELHHWLAAHLSAFKVPRRIYFMRELPRGPTGKVRRHELVKWAMSSRRAARSSRTDDRSIMEENIARLWSALLKRDHVGLDEDFFASGGDSFLAAQMLLELEHLIGRSVPDTILYDAPTIRQVAAQMNAWGPADTWQLIRIQDGTRRPFFFCHGDYETRGYYSRRFATCLGADYPVFVVPPPPLSGDRKLPTIQDMAAELSPLLVSAQSDGPFRLGGYCNGALLALEIGHRLIAAGREVELVVMIDPPSFPARQLFRSGRAAVDRALRMSGMGPARREAVLESVSARAGRVVDRLEQLMRVSHTRRMSLIGSGIRRLTRSVRHTEAAGGNGPALTRARDVLHGRWHRVIANYVPERFPAPVLFFAAEYSGRPWKNYSGDLHIVELPPDHVGAVTTHLHFVTGKIRERLGDA